MSKSKLLRQDSKTVFQKRVQKLHDLADLKIVGFTNLFTRKQKVDRKYTNEFYQKERVRVDPNADAPETSKFLVSRLRTTRKNQRLYTINSHRSFSNTQTRVSSLKRSRTIKHL